MKTYLKRLNVLEGVHTGEDVHQTLDKISRLLLDQLIGDARDGIFATSDRMRITTKMVMAVTQQRFPHDMCEEYENFTKHGLALWEEGKDAEVEKVVG